MSNIPVVSWNENSPAGSDNIALGDNRIREMKTQIREVIDVDHKFESSGQDADNGKHDQVSLLEKADIGTGAEGKPILGAQTVSGKAELMFTDEDDNDIQLTSGGKMDLGSGRLDNNQGLSARNNADDGDLSLIKANTSDQAEVTPALLPAGGVILPEISAPTTAANQGALYTKNDGDQTELYFREESNGDEIQLTNGGAVNVPPGLGAWSDKSSSYGAQQASTDGFVLMNAYRPNSGSITISGYTDGNSDPTTERQKVYLINDYSNYASFCMPVKKSDYWKVVASGAPSSIAVYWIPLGA